MDAPRDGCPHEEVVEVIGGHEVAAADLAARIRGQILFIY
jgi:hypothetical protein